MNINHIAVRSFNRVYAPISEARDLAMQADAGFDAGEWSGPAHGEAAQEEFYGALERVAFSFGMTSDELYCHIMAAAEFEGRCQHLARVTRAQAAILLDPEDRESMVAEALDKLRRRTES